MKPYYHDSIVTIYNGDCREIVPQLEHFELVITDPSYGINTWQGMIRDKSGIPGVRMHPNEKPVPLMKWCIQKAKSKGVIVDLFCGSGTTLRAAKDLNRKAIGIELEERYCEVAAQRMQQEVLDI